MKDDMKDILSLPNHFLNYEKTGDKEDRNKNKDEIKKGNNIASKEVLAATRGLFPIRVGTVYSNSKKGGKESDEHKWMWSTINFGEDEKGTKPDLLWWVQKKNLNKVFMFKKYDLPLQIPKFTSEEYDEYLANLDPAWKKDETLYLWDLLEKYELRFIIIHDRYDTLSYSRSLEDLKLRFYSIAKRLAEVRNEKDSPYLDYDFDINYEKDRKYQLEKYMMRGKEKNEEEKELNEQLRKLDLLIKKKEREQRNLKKIINVSKDNDGLEKAQELMEQTEEKQHMIFGDEKFVYLRGSVMHGPIANLSSKVNKKMDLVLKDLGVPEKPMPTKNIHGQYDTLRKNIVKYFSLVVSLKKKEDEKKRLEEAIKLETPIPDDTPSNLQKRLPDLTAISGAPSQNGPIPSGNPTGSDNKPSLNKKVVKKT